MQFLLVDDNRLLGRFLVSYLRDQNHQCTALTDATKVVDWLDANACDGVILDFAMPEMDGITLGGIIREKHPNLPIVMFTGMGYDEELMKRAREIGVNAYVSKVLGPLEIYCALMRAVGQPVPSQ